MRLQINYVLGYKMLVLKGKLSIKAYLYHHLHCKKFILLFICICTSLISSYIVLCLCDYVYVCLHIYFRRTLLVLFLHVFMYVVLFN